MKKMIIILALTALVLAGCSSATNGGGNGGNEATTPGADSSAKSTRIAAKQTKAARPTPLPPMRVSAMCTLLGKPVDTIVPQGTGVLLFWEWNAATEEQAQAGIDQSQVIVTLDGQPVGSIHMRKPTQANNGMYKVTWWSNVGTLTVGTHTVTYNASWKAQISDGTNTYGPGGMYETQTDTCTITVQ